MADVERFFLEVITTAFSLHIGNGSKRLGREGFGEASDRLRKGLHFARDRRVSRVAHSTRRFGWLALTT